MDNIDITKIRPLADRVLVKRTKAEDRSKGGIIIPDAAKEKLNEGLVLAVGPGRFNEQGIRIEPRVRKGDVVYFEKYAGSDVRPVRFEADDDVIILREYDIIAVKEET